MPLESFVKLRPKGAVNTPVALIVRALALLRSECLNEGVSFWISYAVDSYRTAFVSALQNPKNLNASTGAPVFSDELLSMCISKP